MLDNFISSNLLHLTVQTGHAELPCVGSWPYRLLRLQEMLSEITWVEGCSLNLKTLWRLLSPQQRRRHPPVRDTEWSQFEEQWLPKMQSMAADRLQQLLSLVESLPRGALCPIAEAMAASRRIRNTKLFSLMITLDPDCIPIIGSLAVEALVADGLSEVDLACALIRSGRVDCQALEDLIIINKVQDPRLYLAILQQPPSFSPHWSTAHWILSRTLSPHDPLFEEFVRWSELATHPFKPRWSIRREVKIITESVLQTEPEGQVTEPQRSDEIYIPVKRSSEEWPELHLE